jgi:hypothetical protein
VQHKVFRLIILFGLLSRLCIAQTITPGYFRAPLDIPITLAGSFGELRTNHFHTGIDIKTCGVEGLPVYAAADGYVSRIAVSATGYGNALYITHPNGFTTVYGHLLAYNNEIQKYVKQTQYKTENFELDINIDPGLFPVKKGQLVAFSGNTGSSGGAHLHFEIRETKTEHPVNPLLFGIRVSDTIPPVIRAIKIYPLDSNSYIKATYIGKGLRQVTAVVGQNIKIEAYRDHGRYRLRNIAQLQGQGNIGFAVEANDYEDSSKNKVGVYSIELCVNEEEIYLKTMRKLDFDLKRYINSHVDYPERVKTGRWFEKSFVAPNNILTIYDVLKNKGRVTLSKGNIYHISYNLSDIFQNTSELAFDITSPVTVPQLKLPAKDYDTLLPYQVVNMVNKGNIYMNVPAGTFYENTPFSYSEFPKPKHAYSKCYQLGNAAIPCQDYFEIGIKPENLPDRLRSKACIISYVSGYLGGDYDNGWIKAKTRTLGKFYINVDTAPPSIIPINVRNGKNMANSGQLRFVIRDNMSGLKSFKGTIDGHWVLFQRDAKRALVYYNFDEYCKPGKHQLMLTATDNKDNTRTIKMEFRN